MFTDDGGFYIFIFYTIISDWSWGFFIYQFGCYTNRSYVLIDVVLLLISDFKYDTYRHTFSGPLTGCPLKEHVSFWSNLASLQKLIRIPLQSHYYNSHVLWCKNLSAFTYHLKLKADEIDRYLKTLAHSRACLLSWRFVLRVNFGNLSIHFKRVALTLDLRDPLYYCA